MKKLFVFDWNGCLLADTKICWKANNYVLEHFKRKPISLKRFQETIVVPIQEFYKLNGFTEKEVQTIGPQISKIFHEKYAQTAKNCRTRKGTVELLDWIRKQGSTAIILSNHHLQELEQQLKRLNLRDYFSEIFANSDQHEVVLRKNKQEKLENYLKTQNIGKKDIVILGDSVEEIHVGKHLGITSIAVTGGNYSKARLLAEKPDYLVNHLMEVKRIFEKEF
ncbi:MAG: HAD family hydrolase [Candidatus Diapherotrites archaeon]|nr:HAD family hydrolase [Candidatus Diapherotrites archaeon]